MYCSSCVFVCVLCVEFCVCGVCGFCEGWGRERELDVSVRRRRRRCIGDGNKSKIGVLRVVRDVLAGVTRRRLLCRGGGRGRGGQRGPARGGNGVGLGMG